jgi:hypothetical protein
VVFTDVELEHLHSRWPGRPATLDVRPRRVFAGGIGPNGGRIAPSVTAA